MNLGDYATISVAFVIVTGGIIALLRGFFQTKNGCNTIQGEMFKEIKEDLNKIKGKLEIS